MSTAKYTNKRITREDLVKAVSGEYRTLQSIGDEFGVTRERIRQLIVQHGLQNASGRIKPDSRPTCKECGLKINGNKGRSFHSSCYEKYVTDSEINDYILDKTVRHFRSKGKIDGVYNLGHELELVLEDHSEIREIFPF